MPEEKLKKITATIVAVSKIGDSKRVAFKVLFSDNSSREFDFDVSQSVEEMIAEIKAEVDRLNTVEGQVNDLQNLVGTIIE